jgi:hypothetical protein
MKIQMTTLMTNQKMTAQMTKSEENPDDNHDSIYPNDNVR